VTEPVGTPPARGARTEEDPMNTMIIQAIAAERIRDMQGDAAVVRRTRSAPPRPGRPALAHPGVRRAGAQPSRASAAAAKI
jgi:hypothetical protein